MNDNKSLDGGIATQRTYEYLQALYMSHEAAAERAMNAHTKYADSTYAMRESTILIDTQKGLNHEK